jgi:HPt (histidine-containing phosphotransfer) domain-containing protein
MAPEASAVSSSKTVPGPSEGEFPGEADARVDPEALRMLTRGNERAMRDIIHVFLQLMDRSLGEMDTALSQGQAATLAALGHKLKSSAASVGAPGLSRLCQSLEEAMKAPAASVEGARPLVERIAAATVVVNRQLSNLIDA